VTETRAPEGARHTLTNRQGHPVYDNQNQRTVGARGPATLENYQFLEKISHFDRERVPERVVHARGFLSYGTFIVTGKWGDEPIERYTRAKLFAQEGKQTPVALRFSTVIGGRDSSEAARRPVRVRREVLHRGRQLGPRRQQPGRVLHPRRHQVPRRDPRAQARPRHVPAGPGPDLRLHVPDPGVDAHAGQLVLATRHPHRLPAHAGLRGEHLQVDRRPGRDEARQVPLDAQVRRRVDDRGGRCRRPGGRPRARLEGPPRHHRARRVP
jgi:Catalase